MERSRQYRCSVCNVAFKCRSDWLVHLVLNPHSSKVLRNFQQWESSCKGDLFVISGLEEVENSLLLEYISDNLTTFADVVFFKPKANICIIVGDARELKAFSARQHKIGPCRIKFQPYREISATEWGSYFRSKEHQQNQISNPHSGTSKRKLDETAHSSPSKLIKLSRQHASAQNRDVPLSPNAQSRHSRPQGGAFIDTQGSNWEQDLDALQNSILMPNSQIECRKNIITHLTDVFKKSHPNCKIVPVGSDILGFNLDQTLFTIYFDSKGFTEAENAKPSCNISETTQDVDRLRTSVFVKLKSLQTEGILSNVQCNGANSIKFMHSLFETQCNLLLRPFMMAQTARLCKQIYFMNESVSMLINMVTYWSMQHLHFCEVGLINPYVTYWLVYFFMMKKNVLPPVIELQKSCPYEIVDGQNNVAFSYNENVLSNILNPHKCKVENARSQIEMLLEWFIFMDDALGETNGKGENRKHSLICPRFGELIDKRKFKVCWEAFRQEKKKFTSEQKRVRKLWKQNLIDIGFCEEMWGNLLGLKLPDTLSVQHPLYISENISLAFEGPFSHRFFNAVKQTREKLTKLLSGDSSVSSLLLALSDFSV